MSEDKPIKDKTISIEPVLAGGFIIQETHSSGFRTTSYAFTNAGDLLAFLNKEYAVESDAVPFLGTAELNAKFRRENPYAAETLDKSNPSWDRVK